MTLRWRWVAIAVLLAAFGSARADAPPGAREPLVPSAVFAQVGFAENANAQGVGAATTNAVVSSSIMILVLNYVLTQVFFS